MGLHKFVRSTGSETSNLEVRCANETATIEVSDDETVNGEKLPAGKYGLHAIPRAMATGFMASEYSKIEPRGMSRAHPAFHAKARESTV